MQKIVMMKFRMTVLNKRSCPTSKHKKKLCIVALDDVVLLLQQKANIEEAMSHGLTIDAVCKYRNIATVQPLQTYILVSTDIVSLRFTYLVYSIHSMLLSPVDRLIYKVNHAMITNLMYSKTLTTYNHVCLVDTYSR